MDSELKPKNLNLLERWWSHSLLSVMLQQVSNWRQSSRLVSTGLAGILMLVLLTALPYLSNNQTGLLGAAIAFFWILLWASHDSNQASLWTPIHLPLCCYWAIASIATILSPVKQAAADGWLKLTIFFILFAVMYRVMRLDQFSPGQAFLKWRSLLVGVYLVTTLAVCVYGLSQWVLGAEELATWTDPTSELVGTTRIYSFLGNPNLLAAYLMPAVPLGTVMALKERYWAVKGLTALVAIASATCILFTYSRGGLIGLAVECLVLIFLLAYWWSQRLPKQLLPGVAGGVAGLLALSVMVIPTVRSRFFSIFSGRGDSSNNFRLNVWLSVINMIKARPILGIGPGNKAFNLVYPYYQRPGFSALGAYSVPLEIASETGLVGLACYGWLLFTVLRLGWQQLNRLRADRIADGLWIVGALSAIAGLVSHGLVDTVWYRPQVQILWWLAIALIASFYEAEKPAIEPHSKTNDD